MTLATLLLYNVAGHAQNMAFISDKYTIECAGADRNDGYLLRVTVEGKNVAEAQKKVARSAVHGVLFNGFTGTAAGCITQQAMVADSTVAVRNKDYFEKMFTTWNLSRYATVVVAQAAPPVRLKKGYRITTLVSVDKDQLRRQLEQDGIIKGLSSNF